MKRPDRAGRGAPASGVVTGLRQAGPIAVAGLASNGLNVLVTVVIARILTSRGYGELAQLNGIFLFLSMPGSAVLVGVVRRATALRAAGLGPRVRSFSSRLHRLALTGVVVLVVLAWGLEHLVAHALSLDGSGGIVPIVAAAGFWLALSIDRGLLQARREYGALSANLVVEGTMRMIFVLTLTAAGLGVTGACLGVMLGEASAALHARWASSQKWAHEGLAVRAEPDLVALLPEMESAGVQSAVPAEEFEQEVERAIVRVDVDRSSRRHLASDVMTAFGCLAFLALLQNLDVILLGRESPRHSGAYAAISVAAKALVFGAIALGGYLLPEATIRWHKGEHALRQLATTGLILAVPTLVLLAVAVTVPKLLLRIAFGARLVGGASALATLVVAMAFLCATVLFTNYLLGAGRRWIVAVLGAGTVVAAVALYEAHGQPISTARADLCVQAGLTCVVGIGFAVAHREVANRVVAKRTGLESLPAPGQKP